MSSDMQALALLLNHLTNENFPLDFVCEFTNDMDKDVLARKIKT